VQFCHRSPLLIRLSPTTLSLASYLSSDRCNRSVAATERPFKLSLSTVALFRRTNSSRALRIPLHVTFIPALRAFVYWTRDFVCNGITRLRLHAKYTFSSFELNSLVLLATTRASFYPCISRITVLAKSNDLSSLWSRKMDF
jgi:hypothetical protein